MLDFCPVNITMPSYTQAAGACFYRDTIIACDGISPEICVFSKEGRLLDTKTVKRAYKNIHYDKNTNRYVALGDNHSPIIYYLDTNFNEIAYIRLKYLDPSACGPALADGVPFPCGSDSVILACMGGRVSSFSPEGNFISIVKSPGKNTSAMDYLINGRAEAYYYIEKDIHFVEVTEAGKKFSGKLSKEFSLRTFIPNERSDILGLFGYKCNYNYILPIFTDGEFVLPNTENIFKYIREFTNCEK